MQKVTPFLLFPGNAEEALTLYRTAFKEHLQVLGETRYGQHAPLPAGTLMSATFSLFGSEYIFFNGGPLVPFSDAWSLMIQCDTQEEIDHYWNTLSEGGKQMPCGWLNDRFGLAWQVVPRGLDKMLTDPDAAKAGAVMQAMLQMQKMDLAALEHARANA